ncbi:tryptophan-rich sensory protein [Isoptericola sp. S6320L]|uniref:tryptophan-rich sensory protein n=1 Tax=Isoptericola sp. S6320L TaxID=2926411 RepID=UPI001FF6EA1A|nr:tryptophan-rich sensory protein [Isoptericola sp. S6320L]MCK0118754.1 tryptophan-rich sensory protein [Isoptericola sp. S6320L]
MSTENAAITSSAPPTAADRVRQVVVLLGSLLAIAAAAVGSGAAGGQPVSEAAGGALSAEATVVAPGSPAFSIWSVIYAGLLLFAIVQLLPGRAADPRMRALGWWVLGSMLLNAVWIGVVQAGWLWGSVLVIVALLAVLCVILVRIVRIPAGRPLDTVATDVTIGLYLGWVSIATIADVAATLAADEVGELGLGESVWGAVLAVAGALVVVAISVFARSRPIVTIPVGLAAGWGLAWIAVARTQGPLTDVVVAVAATITAVAAVAAPIVVTLARRPR